MRRIRFGMARRVVAALGIAFMALGGFLLAGPADAAGAAGSTHAPLHGGGSTWSSNAIEQWIRNVHSNYGWTISYDESGSTQGRTGFANGTLDFGASEIPYAISNSNEGDSRPNRGFAYMPDTAGGTAFMYHLSIGGRRVTNLRLSGSTVAKIFTGTITHWNDGAIKKDNPRLALPAERIVPVVRSDGSGATAQVTIWMRQEQAGIWDSYCKRIGRSFFGGHCGVTSFYPVKAGSGFVSKAGSNGVAGYVAQQQAEGAITFVEYSYALNAGFPVAKILNRSGYYTEPTASNVAVSLLQARINTNKSSPDYLTQDLSRVYVNADRRTYPLSSYSYMILPTTTQNDFSRNKGLTLADFGAYLLCEGQQNADRMGYSPLPINLVEAGQAQIKKIQGGNPKIKTVRQCNNPTFDPKHPERNLLAERAPYPPACDKQGPTQCTTGTGGAKGTDTNPSGGGAGSGGASTSAGGASGGAGGSGGGTSGSTGSSSATQAGVGSGTVAGDAATAAGDTGVVGAASDAQLVAAGAPQSLPPTATQVGPGAAMLGSGGVMVAGAMLPPLVGRKSRLGIGDFGGVR